MADMEVSFDKMIDKICDGLYRLRVPFEDLTTSVYFFVNDKGAVIIDSATYPSDVDEYIIPAMNEIGISAEYVKVLALTHNHSDHAGGVERLSYLIPNAKVMAPFEMDVPDFLRVADGDVLLGELQVIHLPGHSKNSVGYLDKRSNTLLSGDCLQLLGIGKYRNGIAYPELYISSAKRLKRMGIKRIVAAHEYDPLGSIAEGESDVEKYLNMCIDIASEL